MSIVKQFILWLVIIFGVETASWSQVIIFTAQNNGVRYLYQIDLATCQYCPILPTSFGVTKEVLMLPNGNVIVCGGGQ